MKKFFKRISIIIITLISLSVLYTAGYRGVFYVLNNRAVSAGGQIIFEDYSQGLTWINEQNSRTLFFIPSSEEIAVNNLYGSWLKELFNEQGVNIIVPPSEADVLTPRIQSGKISMDSRIKNTEYLYRLYSNQLPENHEITILTTGDGSITALEMAKMNSTMDKLIFISPVNNTPERRTSFFQKMEGLPLIHFVLPWLPRHFGQNRVAPYDIVNDKLNGQFGNTMAVYYPKYLNMAYSRDISTKTQSQAETMNLVKANRFFIIYGDDDLSYGLEGFERMGDQLEDGGSEVSIMRIPQSGRLILFDNDSERIVDLISILLQ